MIFSYLHNPAGWETAVHNLKSDLTPLALFTYTYDDAGNRVQVEELGGILASYTYDLAGQLTRERRNGANAYDTTYTYDGAQNRVTKEDSGQVTAYEYNGANELTLETPPSGSPTTRTYDANGNLHTEDTGGAVTTYTWDDEDRLVRVESPSGTEDYEYHPDGLRRKKVTGSGTSIFVWDGENVLIETDGSLVTVAHYVDYPGIWGGLVSQRRGSTSSFYGFDLQANTCVLVSAAQAITDTYDYKAFGEELAVTGTTLNPYRFGGDVRYYGDTASRIYVEARHLDAVRGRWLSRDPTWWGGSNRYVYVANGPVNAVDPQGLQGLQVTLMRLLWLATRPASKAEISGSSWGDVLGRTVRWAAGSLPTSIRYGPNDPATKALRASWGAEEMRTQYIRSGRARGGWGRVSTPGAFFNTINQPLNAQQAFLGAFDYEWRACGGTVTFTVRNITDTKSFLYHLPPLYRPIEWLRRRHRFAPMQRVEQVFTWKETDPSDPSRPAEGPFDPWVRSYPGTPQFEIRK